MGRIDHLAYNIINGIVYVAELGNKTVDAVDLNNKVVSHTISSLQDPQGILYIPESNTIAVTCGGDGAVNFYNAETFDLITTDSLGDDADNIRYDPTAKKIYIAYGNGGIAIINATTFKKVGDIKINGHPETFTIDKTAGKIYVNVPIKHQIQVIDLANNEITERWAVKDARSNFPMYLDEANHRLFIGCRDPAKLIVFDTKTGKPISSFDIDREVDDIYYDSFTKQIFLTCGAGYIDIFRQIDANTYKANGKVETAKGARTALLIPELMELIVAKPAEGDKQAQLLVYKIVK
jgi:DNA-binding beta-propeller fold protein YncE